MNKLFASGQNLLNNSVICGYKKMLKNKKKFTMKANNVNRKQIEIMLEFNKVNKYLTRNYPNNNQILNA